MYKEFLICYILFFLIIKSFSKLNPSKVQLAINCGGGSITTKTGIRYIADYYYNGGESSAFGEKQKIKYTEDKEVYHTERWSKDNLEYSIPINGEGSFVIILQFSEVYFSSKGEKIFDVEINGIKVLIDLDIFEKVGKNSALEEYITIKIIKGELYIKNEKANFDGKNLQISFVKGLHDNPKINGIVIVKGTLEDTNYNEYMDILENEEKIKIINERKHRDFHRMSKSIDYEDFEDDFIDDGRFNLSGNGIFSIKGFILIILIIGFGYIQFVK